MKMNPRKILLHVNPSLRTAFAAAVLATLALPALAHHVEKHFTVDGRPIVIIRNSSGRIQVKSWNKPEVLIVGDHASSSVDLETEQAGSRVEIETRVLNDSARGADLQMDYQVTVPEETELQIRTDSGSIMVASVHGNLTFDTLAADVNLQDVGGMVMVTTADGSVVCSRCDGTFFKAESVSGNIQLFQPVMDEITVHTTAGNILFDGDFLRHGLYVMRSDTGNTEVRFGAASSFDLKANSAHGSVINQASLQPDKHGKKVNAPKYSKSLLGTVGNGNAKVELYSFNGTIKILKRDQASLTQ
jgi:DUF4097 and DUF4098 domain-containing protein YvlB